jgi:hypothetical protein
MISQLEKLKNFPPVYYISLEESLDRQISIEEQLKKYQIKNYTSLISKRFNECDDTIKGRYVHLLNNTNKGCTTSFLRIIKKWLTETDTPYAVFFEDDVSFETVEYWNFTWEDFYNSLPLDWDAIQLIRIRENQTKILFREKRLEDWAVTAFLLKRDFGKKLLEKFMISDTEFLLDIEDTLPIVENIIFSTGKVYNFPLFVENTNLPSTFIKSPDYSPQIHDSCVINGQGPAHHESRSHVLEWWKNIGNNLKLEEILKLTENNLTKIVYVGRSKGEDLCEYEFIMNELIPENNSVETRFMFLDDIRNTSETFDILVYSARYQCNHPWGWVPSYEEILECIVKVKPKIVIQLSDEFKDEDLQDHNKLANYCKLFMRQYHHKNYFYTDNTVHIPLAYRNGFNISNKQIKEIRDREYNWVFFGTYKSDRKQAIDAFSKIKNSKYVLRDESSTETIISSDELISYFLNSIFVLCSRGWSTVDTMRLYEASISGCIPVVVVSEEERSIVFKYEENPPWLFFETWEKAAEECLKILENKEKLQEIQNQILLWWKNRLSKIKNKIRLALETR